MLQAALTGLKEKFPLASSPLSNFPLSVTMPEPLRLPFGWSTKAGARFEPGFSFHLPAQSVIYI